MQTYSTSEKSFYNSTFNPIQSDLKRASPFEIAKPFLFAIVIALAFAFALSLLFLALAQTLTPNSYANQPKHDATIGSISKQQTGVNTIPYEPMESFIHSIKQKHKTVTSGALHTINLGSTLLYRINQANTYQEVATIDARESHHITQQLDAHGIEYEIGKNESDQALLRKGEYIISWGGVLYLPQGSDFLTY
jgi:hypothetical protein